MHVAMTRTLTGSGGLAGGRLVVRSQDVTWRRWGTPVVSMRMLWLAVTAAAASIAMLLWAMMFGLLQDGLWASASAISGHLIVPPLVLFVPCGTLYFPYRIAFFVATMLVVACRPGGAPGIRVLLAWIGVTAWMWLWLWNSTRLCWTLIYSLCRVLLRLLCSLILFLLHTSRRLLTLLMRRSWWCWTGARGDSEYIETGRAYNLTRYFI